MYAFRLSPEFEKSFSGGSVVCSTLGHTFDIGKTLKDNEDGVIYTTNEYLGEALTRYDALERIPQEEVSKEATPVEVPGEGSTLTAEDLTRQEQVPRGQGEIPAEHRDEPATPEEAVQAGEAVSGSGSKSGSSSKSSSSSRN